jgi:hypothetical protein
MFHKPNSNTMKKTKSNISGLNKSEKKSISEIFGKNAIEKAESIIVKGGTTTNPNVTQTKIIINTDIIN